VACPLCGGEDSIGHILGSCAHADIRHMYTFRHDTEMRSLLKLIQTSSKGNYYTADVGTQEAMAALGAGGKRLPEWLVTSATMKACGCPPHNKDKLRPDCMIIEIPKCKVPIDTRKRKFGKGSHGVGTQTLQVDLQVNGCARKIWIIELGYSSDTRCLDKVKGKTEQHEVSCKLLAHEGYEVIFLPIVLGSAGTLFQCVERATKELGILSTQKDKLYSKLHLHSIHTLHKLVQLRRSLERSAEARGRIKGRWSAECSLSYPQGQAGKPAYPLRRKALIFTFFYLHTVAYAGG